MKMLFSTAYGLNRDLLQVFSDLQSSCHSTILRSIPAMMTINVEGSGAI
jgi:hypothetical protein